MIHEYLQKFIGYVHNRYVHLFISVSLYIYKISSLFQKHSFYCHILPMSLWINFIQENIKGLIILLSSVLFQLSFYSDGKSSVLFNDNEILRRLESANECYKEFCAAFYTILFCKIIRVKISRAKKMASIKRGTFLQRIMCSLKFL